MNETEVKVAHYPLDVSLLTKGQVLTIAELEKIFGLTYPDPRWWKKLLTLQTQIARAREKAGLPLMTTRTRRGALIICDDPDASTYNARMGRRGLRRFGRASIRNVAVDVTKLTEEEARTHSRTLMRQAMLAVAIRGARYRALEKPAENGRVTPRMVCGPTQATDTTGK